MALDLLDALRRRPQARLVNSARAVKQVCTLKHIAGLVLLLLSSRAAYAEDIVIGQTMPYSGTASAYSAIGRAEAAYFAKINEEGGIRGRRIRLISLDDSYTPSKTVEQTRKLVEQDEVLLVFSTFGTSSNAVIKKYLNSKQIPQLFPTGGGLQWNDPINFPWSFGWQPSYVIEMKAYVDYILSHKPNAKIAVLYQNGDVGEDNLKGLKEALGDRFDAMVVKTASYEFTDATVDSQVITLKSSGADVFLNLAAGKFATQAIAKAAQLGWKPLQFLSNYSSSVTAVLAPAGLENGIGIISSQYLKDPTDPKWRSSPDFIEWERWMDRYYATGDKTDNLNVYGYVSAEALVAVLRQCDHDLSREAVRAQMENLRSVSLPMMLPGLVLETSKANHAPFDKTLLTQFNGKSWESLNEN